MSPRALRILATVYLVKTLIVGIVWMSAPEVPRRAWERLRQTFSSAAPASPAGDETAAP
jgi:hypothetical protein